MAAGGANEPTVTRAYYLNFQATGKTPTSGGNTRWALLLNGGKDPQPIYRAFVNR